MKVYLGEKDKTIHLLGGTEMIGGEEYAHALTLAESVSKKSSKIFVCKRESHLKRYLKTDLKELTPLLFKEAVRTLGWSDRHDPFFNEDILDPLGESMLKLLRNLGEVP